MKHSSVLLLFTSSLSLPLCVLALRTPPKAASVFRLPDFPASLSFCSVQSYYRKLIQLLGKAIFSVQKEDSMLLARYSASFAMEAPYVLRLYLFNQSFDHFTLLLIIDDNHFLPADSTTCVVSLTHCVGGGWTLWAISKT